MTITVDGAERVIEVDTVILCAGQEPNRALAAGLDDALAQLDEVVRLNPRDGEAWLYRGELLLSRRQDVPSARAAWQKALALAPATAGWSALARRRLAEHPE